jgi:hypothetical protein
MTIHGALRWSLRPRRIAVLIGKLLLAGSTDLAAQTTSWQQVNGVQPVSMRHNGQVQRRGNWEESASLSIHAAVTPLFVETADFGPDEHATRTHNHTCELPKLFHEPL